MMGGWIQCAERINCIKCATSGAIEGTSCEAVQPFPMTATFLPSNETLGSHRAEWICGPVKISRPGKGGV